MPAARRSGRKSAPASPFSPSKEAQKPQFSTARAGSTPGPKASKAPRSPSRSPSPAKGKRSASPSPYAKAVAPPKAKGKRDRSRSASPAPVASIVAVPVEAWSPGILAWPTTDLVSLVICGYIGGWYVFTAAGNEGLSADPFTLYAAAAAGAWLTAFGGGLLCLTMLTLATPGGEIPALDTLSCTQKINLVAALVGFAASVPTGAHPFDCFSMDKDLFNYMECLNWAILVGWAVSKLAALSSAPLKPAPTTLLLVAFPAGYAYCSAGGITRNLLYTAALTSSVPLPTNLMPGVAIPMAFGLAAYAAIMQITASVLPIRSVGPLPLDMLLGVPAVAYIFYLASLAGMGDWETTVVRSTRSQYPHQHSLCRNFSLTGEILLRITQPVPTVVSVSVYPEVGVTFGEPVGHSPVALMVTPVLGFLALALAR